MNIFYLHRDPYTAAAVQYNKHVVKMTLESAQMLCTAHHHYAEQHEYDNSYIPYKKAHYNHPCSIWVRQNKNHYRWLFNHMKGLGEEYRQRYNREHLSITKCLEPLSKYPVGMPDGKFEQPPQAMPDEYKHPNSIIAYWQYYIGAKSNIANIDEKIYRKIPKFETQELHNF